MKIHKSTPKPIKSSPLACRIFGNHRYDNSHYEPRYSHAGLAGSLGGYVPPQSQARLVLWCECGQVKVVPIL